MYDLFCLQELTEEGLPFLILFHHPDDKEITQRFSTVVQQQLMSEKCKLNNYVFSAIVEFWHPVYLKFLLKNICGSLLELMLDQLADLFVKIFFFYVLSHIKDFLCIFESILHLIPYTCTGYHNFYSKMAKILKSVIRGFLFNFSICELPHCRWVEVQAPIAPSW